ncbi:MAG TPA: Re/Si-specific NAD(P)(+) transhydrogenase subunit alpha [Alphaproteobacteria bacterium]|nr:Re/Si-specific NAD(P)(+) transhydrogenase subunit alpha [Alphaproteobacteria bacterium]
MQIAVLKERRVGEARVAATPDTVKKLVGLGQSVVIEAGAGAGSSIPDARYAEAGATIAPDAASALKDADVVFKVQRPLRDGAVNELALMKQGATLISALGALQNKDDVAAYASAGITAFAMELVPRITRAQSMDILSSQANLAGYRAVLEACAIYGRVLPMMMTAAGTVAPARVFIMGVGVAGLQAIATARRLGAVVSATDVRPATKEQVESLGGKFVMVEDDETKQAETSGGYAREMSDEYKRKQAALIAETIKKQDIVITTALIPGRKAPVLVSEEMVASMKPGSVIVDLAVEAGGNCPLSKPDQIVDLNGVKIAGFTNLPSRIAEDASALYAKNLLAFITPLIDKETKALKIDAADEIVAGTLVTQGGQIVHPNLKAGA